MTMPQTDAPIALVVEQDNEARNFASALIEETDLDVIACASAEQALSVLEDPQVNVALVFADTHLTGEMDGIALAQAVERRWPDVRLVVTSEPAEDCSARLPRGAVHMPKPWNAFAVLVQAERATVEAQAA